MSLESKIEQLTTAINSLVTVMSNGNATAPAPAPTETPAPAAPKQEAPAPTAPSATPAPTPAPEQTAPVAAPSEMPAAPDLNAAPAPAPTGAPFTDATGLVSYVMEAYKAIGAEKGAQIGNILAELGYQNINDVKPEHYDALHAKIEELKA